MLQLHSLALLCSCLGVKLTHSSTSRLYSPSTCRCPPRQDRRPGQEGRGMWTRLASIPAIHPLARAAPPRVRRGMLSDFFLSVCRHSHQLLHPQHTQHRLNRSRHNPPETRQRLPPPPAVSSPLLSSRTGPWVVVLHLFAHASCCSESCCGALSGSYVVDVQRLTKPLPFLCSLPPPSSRAKPVFDGWLV